MKSILIGATSLVAMLAGAVAASADNEKIYASCKKDLQLTDSGCQCVLKEVADNLNEHQTEMLVVMIGEDKQAVAQAMSSGKLSGEDMLFLTNFMTTTPTKCQNQ